MMHKITQVEVLEGFKLRLTYKDGTTGVVDMAYLAGRGVFSSLEQPP